MSAAENEDRYFGPFPKDRTLVVNGIGAGSISSVAALMDALERSGGSREVLAVSVVGADPDLAKLLKKMPGLPRQGGFFGGKALAFGGIGGLNGILEMNRLNGIAEMIDDQSHRYNDSARAICHLIPFYPDSYRQAGQVLKYFQSRYRHLFQFAVLTVPLKDEVSRSTCEYQEIEGLADLRPIPMIVVDQLPAAGPETSLLPEEAFYDGLAGLIANRRVPPQVNSLNYIEMLRALSSPVVGVGVGIKEGRLFGDQRRDKMTQELLRCGREAIEQALDGRSFLTSHRPLQDPAAELLVVQYPPVEGFREIINPSFRQAVYPHEIGIGRYPMTVVPGASKRAESPSRFDRVVATYFYPAEPTSAGPWGAFIEALESSPEN